MNFRITLAAAVLSRWRLLRPLLSEASQPVFDSSIVVLGLLLVGYILPIDPAGTRPLRFAGTILQLLGVWTVAVGISGRRRVFHRPSLITRMVSALRGPQNITLHAAISGGMSMVGGLGSVIVGVAPGATVEQRVAALERSIEAIRHEIQQTTDSLNKAVAGALEHVEQEASARTAAVAEVKGQLEELLAGGIYVDSIGVLWLFAGVVLTGLPDEVAALSRWLVS